MGSDQGETSLSWMAEVEGSTGHWGGEQGGEGAGRGEGELVVQ